MQIYKKRVKTIKFAACFLVDTQYNHNYYGFDCKNQFQFSRPERPLHW